MSKALFTDTYLRNETARGYLLIGVIIVHCFYDLTDNATPATAPITFALIKTFSPDVIAFFFLSGLTAQNLNQRKLMSILQQSLTLIFLSWASHIIGVIMEDLLLTGTPGGYSFLKQIGKPILFGTGGATYITWFFVTLAIVRIFVWMFMKKWQWFVFAWAFAILLIVISKELNLPDNVYEWRHWPLATVFMLAGVYFPRDLRLSGTLGFFAFLISLGLIWLDHPGLLNDPLCQRCELTFVSEPKLGFTGPIIIYILAEVFFCLALISAAQATRPMVLIRTCRFFGHASIQLLLVNGWVLTSIQPFLSTYFPEYQGVIVVLAAIVIAPLLHAILFITFENQIDFIISKCAEISRDIFRRIDHQGKFPSINNKTADL